ncbi:MAG TPA: hypothetical protein VD927_13040, partial [Chryseosolibacter sp.]|nr:hypothetical protein [Chryseosolibacter sp.]
GRLSSTFPAAFSFWECKGICFFNPAKSFLKKFFIPKTHQQLLKPQNPFLPKGSQMYQYPNIFNKLLIRLFLIKALQISKAYYNS